MYPWPNGNYACYISIFNCNPRFIKEKEFQAYFRHPSTINYVCVHEMLHFIFYDYLEKCFSDEYKSLGDKSVWKLSEIINDVVLRLPEFVALTGQKNPPIYAETSEELKKYANLWDVSGDIGKFIEDFLKVK
jgi:hypothetical protein